VRRKAIDAVKAGHRKVDVAQMFQISRNTLDLWLKREAEIGDCQAVTQYQRGCRHKITEWSKFREFAEQHGHRTQGQMAKVWEDGVTQQNISDALRKIGFSRKKNVWVSGTG
jgi:transposase